MEKELAQSGSLILRKVKKTPERTCFPETGFFFIPNFWWSQKIPHVVCITFSSKVGCYRAEKGGFCEVRAAKSWFFGSKFHNLNWSAHRKNSPWTRPGNGQTRLVLLRNDQKKIFQQGVFRAQYSFVVDGGARVGGKRAAIVHCWQQGCSKLWE